MGRSLSTQHRRGEAALSILAAHNLVQNLVLNERGYVTGNLVVSGLLIGLGRNSGLSWEAMGLGKGDTRSGLRMGTATALGGLATGGIALASSRIRPLLRDDRAATTSMGDVWRRALIRFPLGTALFEEVAFRGVLPALFGGPWRGDLLSAGAFGLWHLIPTQRALAGNPASKGMPAARRVGAVVGGSLAAGVAGLALSALRRRTGSLLAPWLVHASFNSLSYLAGVTAHRMGGTPNRHGRPSPPQ